MQQHTADCRAAGIPFAADFSQQVAFLDGDAMRTLIEGAAYLFCNEYEAAVIESKTGWSGEDILARVGTRIITLGARGRPGRAPGEEPLVVGPVTDATFVEPTGAGDAFRCGFLAATAWGLPLERAVQLGNLMAVHALETVGPQEYELKPAQLADRARRAYGDEAAADLAAHLPAYVISCPARRDTSPSGAFACPAATTCALALPRHPAPSAPWRSADAGGLDRPSTSPSH